MFEQETLEMGQLGELEGLTFEAEEEDEFYPGLGEQDRYDYEEEGGPWGEQFDDREGDRFLGSLISRAGNALGKATGGIVNADLLKSLARQAATVAGGAIAGPTGAQIAGKVANAAIREAEAEGEGSYEAEGNYEERYEAAGGDRQLLDEMHYYAAMLSEAEGEAEADHFLGAIAKIAGPMLSSLFGGMGEASGEQDRFLGDILGGLVGEEELGESERDGFLPALIPFVAPLIGQGISALGKLFARNKETESAGRAIPEIVAETGRDLRRQYRSGVRPSRGQVARTLARNTARTLASRRRLGDAMRSNRRGAARAQSRPLPRRRPGGGTPMRRGSMSMNGNGRPSRGYGSENGRSYDRSADRDGGRGNDHDGRGYDTDRASGRGGRGYPSDDRDYRPAPTRIYTGEPRIVRARGRGALVGYIPVYGVRRPRYEEDED